VARNPEGRRGSALTAGTPDLLEKRPDGNARKMVKELNKQI